MYPWLFFWAPHLYFPFSGSVAQRIEPDTNWFFDSIETSAGDGTIEKKAFEIASYGRQLGLITEVLIEVAEKVTLDAPGGQESLNRLKSIRDKIETLKDADAAALAREIQKGIARLQKTHKAVYPTLRKQLQHALEGDGK